MTQFIDTLRDNILFPVVDGNTNKYMSADRLMKSIQYLLLDILKHKHFDENTFRAEIDEILQKSRQAYMVSFDAKATAEDAKSQLLAVIEASNNATEKSEKAYALAQQAIDETAKIPDIKIIAGTWWINGVDTGLPSKGDPGQFDFDSLTDEQKALLKDFINSVIAEYDFSKDISTELKLIGACTILATEHKCGLYTDVQVYMSDTSLNWEKVITDVTKNATGDITITVKNVDFTNIGKVLVQIHKITAPV